MYRDIQEKQRNDGAQTVNANSFSSSVHSHVFDSQNPNQFIEVPGGVSPGSARRKKPFVFMTRYLSN
jgi:hypothetical protein